MSHFGRARGSRNVGSCESNSRQTARKISAASSRERPYLMGIEKIRFLYLSISADQDSSLPFKHPRTNRSSEAAGRSSAVFVNVAVMESIRSPCELGRMV